MRPSGSLNPPSSSLKMMDSRVRGNDIRGESITYPGERFGYLQDAGKFILGCCVDIYSLNFWFWGSDRQDLRIVV